MRNYLARLSWSHGDDEIMSDAQMIEWFDIDGIGKSSARFDFAKLESFNAHYLRARSDADLLALLISELPHLVDGDAFRAKLDPVRERRLAVAMPLLKERAKTLVDLIDAASFLVAERPLVPDAAAAALLDAGGRRLLAGAGTALRAVAQWSVPETEAAVKAYAAREAVKLGQVAQPLRAALTGRAASPGIFEILTIIGREESLGRISDQTRT
jgi:glutamyl-tRNA synthetase